MHIVLNHPLVNHRVTLLRNRETPPKLFRELVDEITTFIVYEAMRDARTRPIEVETPIAKTVGQKIDEPGLVIVPILRAGIGMMNAMLDALPFARVGVLGMQRDKSTGKPSPYYRKVLPAKSGEELALVIDPMLATGGSACDAVSELKGLGYKRIKFLNLISAPEGIARFEKEHPDVPVFTAAKDERLNSKFYIVPGLGDAGDRIFATF